MFIVRPELLLILTQQSTIHDLSTDGSRSVICDEYYAVIKIYGLFYRINQIERDLSSMNEDNRYFICCIHF